MVLPVAVGSRFLFTFPFQEIFPIVMIDTVRPIAFSVRSAAMHRGESKPLLRFDRVLNVLVVGPNGSAVYRLNVDDRNSPMTIPFGDPEPSDAMLGKSVTSTRLRAWLSQRLRHLATAQRIQDARALRSEFSME